MVYIYRQPYCCVILHGHARCCVLVSLASISRMLAPFRLLALSLPRSLHCSLPPASYHGTDWRGLQHILYHTRTRHLQQLLLCSSPLLVLRPGPPGEHIHSMAIGHCICGMPPTRHMKLTVVSCIALYPSISYMQPLQASLLPSFILQSPRSHSRDINGHQPLKSSTTTCYTTPHQHTSSCPTSLPPPSSSMSVQATPRWVSQAISCRAS